MLKVEVGDLLILNKEHPKYNFYPKYKVGYIIYVNKNDFITVKWFPSERIEKSSRVTMVLDDKLFILLKKK